MCSLFQLNDTVSPLHTNEFLSKSIRKWQAAFISESYYRWLRKTFQPGVSFLLVTWSLIKWCLTAEVGEGSWPCNADNWPYLLCFRKTSPRRLVCWQVSQRHWDVQLTMCVTDPLGCSTGMAWIITMGSERKGDGFHEIWSFITWQEAMMCLPTWWQSAAISPVLCRVCIEDIWKYPLLCPCTNTLRKCLKVRHLWKYTYT